MFPISIKDVKDVLSIETTEHDNYIEKMIPITLALTEQYCNNKTLVLRDALGNYMKTNEGYMLTDMGLIIVIAKIIEFYMVKAGITYEAIGRMVYTYANDLPTPILNALKSYSKSAIRYY